MQGVRSQEVQCRNDYSTTKNQNKTSTVKLLQRNINRRKAPQSLVCQCTKFKSLITGVIARGKSVVLFLTTRKAILRSEKARGFFR